MANFWWKTSSSKGQDIIWMSWDHMATQKNSGGLGFRHLDDFNLAMLAKQGWRLLCSPSSLASRLYKAKYYPQTDFLNVELGNNHSFFWQSIWSSQSLVKLGARRTIGTGESNNILKHPWLPDPTNPYVTSLEIGHANQMVSSILEIYSKAWDTPLVNDMFNKQDAELIIGIPSSSSAAEDCWSWTGDKSAIICHWLDYFFNNYDDDVSCRAIMVCWALWKVRNTLVSNSKASSLTQSRSMLMHGAFFEKENAYSFGVVARDSSGHLVDLTSKYQVGSYAAEVIEALRVRLESHNVIGFVVKEALSWLKGKGWSKVKVETNRMVTVQAIFSKQQMTSIFGLIINDYKFLLSSLQNVSLRFIRRLANRVTHFVVRWS
ncbi:hypothetical protein CsatA_007006 [Cannabis sativa]